MMNFRGPSSITLDDKGRLAMPTRYRGPLMDHCDGLFVATIDPDQATAHCLLLYPLPAWEAVEATVNALPGGEPAVRQFQRLFIGHAADVRMDGAGRILLPGPLRDYAQLAKAVALIGQGNKFEVWDEGLWERSREVWLAAPQAEKPEALRNLSL